MKINKRRIFIMLLAIVLLTPISITFTKYVHNFIYYHLLTANNFYFNSDKLSADGATYSIENWGGATSFTIQFELNNNKNNILKSDSDITYELSLSCSTDITCSLDYTSGTLQKSELSDKFVITVSPDRTFDSDETISVSVTANSTSPYLKTLSATFNATVGKKGISYEIIDSANQPYLIVSITNALEEYKCITASEDYDVGDIIGMDQYKLLSDTDKDLFRSAVITLTFDPNIVIIDNTSSIVSTADKTNTDVSGVSYINSLEFGVDASSSTQIRFYKKDATQNYTYPITNDTSIIQFNAQT